MTLAVFGPAATFRGHLAARRPLSSHAHAESFGVPTDSEALIRLCLPSGDDIDLIRTRRRAENRPGLAVHISLPRHPGPGWSEGLMPPVELITWVAGQLQVDAPSLDDHPVRRNARHERQPSRCIVRGRLPSGRSMCSRKKTLPRGPRSRRITASGLSRRSLRNREGSAWRCRASTRSSASP